MKTSSRSAGRITRHTDLDVYKEAFAAAMKVFRHTSKFPGEERYSLTDQVRRSSRSVCSNLAEGWRRRRYEAAFRNKLNESEGEAAETQVWLQFAVECGYLDRKAAAELYREYDGIIAKLVVMSGAVEKWVLPNRSQ